MNAPIFILIAAVLLQTTRPNVNQETATDPVAQRDHRARHFARRHDQNLRRTTQGPVELLFVGDSLTENWERVPQLWRKFFGKHNAANFGIGGDRTQNILWRMQNGELDHIRPRVVVLLAGTNNLFRDSPDAIAAGVDRIVRTIREKHPQATVILIGLLPCERGDAVSENVAAVNARIAKLDDGKSIRYLDIGPKMLDSAGRVSRSIMPDGLHLNENGYEIWGTGMAGLLSELIE